MIDKEAQQQARNQAKILNEVGFDFPWWVQHEMFHYELQRWGLKKSKIRA